MTFLFYSVSHTQKRLTSCCTLGKLFNWVEGKKKKTKLEFVSLFSCYFKKENMFLAHTFFPLGFFFICRMFLFCLKINKNTCLLPKRFPFHACKNESFLISFILFQTKKKGTEKARGNTFQGFFSCLKQKKKSGFLRKVFSCTNSFSTWFSTHATMFSCIFCSTHGKQTQKPSGKFYKLVFVFMFESE